MANERYLEDMPTPEIPWVKVTEQPTTYEIQDVTFVTGKYGKRDTVLNLRHKSSLMNYRLTVWGGNYNYLYNTFGANAANWVGKDIQVKLEGKNRVVSLP